MPYVVTCSACSQHLSIADDVFANRVVGKKVSLRCTRCRETIRVDGRSEEALALALASGALRKVESAAQAAQREPPKPAASKPPKPAASEPPKPAASEPPKRVVAGPAKPAVADPSAAVREPAKASVRRASPRSVREAQSPAVAERSALPGAKLSAAVATRSAEAPPIKAAKAPQVGAASKPHLPARTLGKTLLGLQKAPASVALDEPMTAKQGASSPVASEHADKGEEVSGAGMRPSNAPPPNASSSAASSNAPLSNAPLSNALPSHALRANAPTIPAPPSVPAPAAEARPPAIPAPPALPALLLLAAEPAPSSTKELPDAAGEAAALAVLPMAAQESAVDVDSQAGVAAARTSQPDVELTPSAVVLTSEATPPVPSKAEAQDGAQQQPKRRGTGSLVVAAGAALALAAGIAFVVQRAGLKQVLFGAESKLAPPRADTRASAEQRALGEAAANTATAAVSTSNALAAPQPDVSADAAAERAAPAPVETATSPGPAGAEPSEPTDAASTGAESTGPTPTDVTKPGALPAYVSEEVVLRHVAAAVRRAELCHQGGRAAGTAQLFVTFSPRGRVSAARLEGEPIASAPVARCVLDHARAILIPKFEGEAFTIQQTITLL